jgi:hypothetical protein
MANGEPEGSKYKKKVPPKVEPSHELAVVTAAESGGGADKIPIRTTLPDELLRHNISDEELDMLGETKRSFFHEFMWATITGALGAAPAAIHDLGEAYVSTPAKPLSGFELFEVIVFFGFAILAIFSGIMVRQETIKDPSSLKEKIRARTRSIQQA